MCGIAVIRGNGKLRYIALMMDRLRHRGPDEQGIYIGEGCLLGHNRLSIIDIEKGKQPIYNEKRDTVIIYNGEVYNFKELRDKLPSHIFSTRTDTEVILHLFEEKGSILPESLDGMFALAIWNGKELFAARDPLGIKPLYYGRGGNLFFMASEIKAISPLVDKVYEFPAGHFYDSSRDSFIPYFHLTPQKRNNYEMERELRELLIKAVVKRLVSDVPVGIFLSGGFDSSIIATIARRHKNDLHTFSVGMEDSSDLKFSRKLAQELGTIHHELIYREEDIISNISKIIYYLESFDAALVRSAIPCFFVSKLARENGVKVILTGEGADELFAGYEYLEKFTEPAALQNELMDIILGLHNTNLQRLDRMGMANSVEGRVPFLDISLVSFGLGINPSLKLKKNGIEKLLLRQAFKEWLPEEILWRKKEKFSKGAGSSQLLWEKAQKEISDREFEKEKVVSKDFILCSKEELYYYRLFQNCFSSAKVLGCIGRSHSV